MAAITKTQLDNASLDAKSLEDFANGPNTQTVVSRLGAEYPTIEKFLLDNQLKIDNAQASALAVILADSANAANGDAKIAVKQTLTGAVARTQHDKNADVLNAKDLGVIGDGVTDDRNAINAAITTAADAGKMLVFPRATYLCNGWIHFVSNSKIWCEPGTVFKLGGNTALGGFLCGGYNLAITTKIDCANVDIFNMTLDCNNVSGENAFNAVRANGVRFYNPRAINVRHNSTTLGGRAFQFEGDVVTGIHVWNPNIENCSIGINSHADSTGATERSADIVYYGVTMRNVDIPFNVDGQFATPESAKAENVSTHVVGATLWNCGKITWPGNSGALGGGIVCGDRGSGLRIGNMRIVNETSYGTIGALVRGLVYGFQLNDVSFEGPGMTAVYDFNPCGFGNPANSAAAPFIITENVRVKTNLDYLVKAAGAGVGACRLACSVYGSVASLTGFVDANAGASTVAIANFHNVEDNIRTGEMRLKDLLDGGNAFANFARVQTGFFDIQHVKLLNSASNTGVFKLPGVANSRLTVEYLVAAHYPASVGDASIVAHKGILVGAVDGGGVFTRTIGTAATATALDGVATHTLAIDLALISGEIYLTVNQTNTATSSACDVYVKAQVIYSVGSTRTQPKVTLL
jgi:hypothetical protein